MLEVHRKDQELQINVWQIRALEEFIIFCQDGTLPAKQAIVWLLRQTHRLADEVAVYFPENVPLGEEVANALHAMESSNGKSFIFCVLSAMGSHMMFVHHCGFCLNVPEGQDKPEGGYTIWVSRNLYDHNVPQIQLDLDAISTISTEEIIKGD